MLEWEENGPWEGYRSSGWGVDVCPAPLVDVWGRIWPRHAVPFLKVDFLSVRAGYFCPLWRELYQANGLKRDLGYFEDDPADIEAFLTHLEHWFVDLAVPQGLAWLADPTLILDAMKAPPYSLDKNMPVRVDPGNSDVAVAVMAPLVGRTDDAKDAVERLQDWRNRVEAGMTAFPNDPLPGLALEAIRQMYPALFDEQPER